MSTMERDKTYSHEEIFGPLYRSSMCWMDAAGYLEISFRELMQRVRDGDIKPDARWGTRFSVPMLKRYKRRMKDG